MRPTNEVLDIQLRLSSQTLHLIQATWLYFTVPIVLVIVYRLPEISAERECRILRRADLRLPAWPERTGEHICAWPNQRRSPFSFVRPLYLSIRITISRVRQPAFPRYPLVAVNSGALPIPQGGASTFALVIHRRLPGAYTFAPSFWLLQERGRALIFGHPFPRRMRNAGCQGGHSSAPLARRSGERCGTAVVHRSLFHSRCLGRAAPIGRVDCGLRHIARIAQSIEQDGDCGRQQDETGPDTGVRTEAHLTAHGNLPACSVLYPPPRG